MWFDQKNTGELLEDAVRIVSWDVGRPDLIEEFGLLMVVELGVGSFMLLIRVLKR